MNLFIMCDILILENIRFLEDLAKGAPLTLFLGEARMALI